MTLRRRERSPREEQGHPPSTQVLVSWHLAIFGHPIPTYDRSGRDGERFDLGHRPCRALRPYLLEEFEPKPGGGF